MGSRLVSEKAGTSLLLAFARLLVANKPAMGYCYASATRSICWFPPMGHLNAKIHSRFVSLLHMGSCQNYGPFLGTLNIWCRIIIGTQKGTIILTTTHIF